MLDAYTKLKELNFERLAGTIGEKKAATIIKKTLQGFGLEPKEENFKIKSFETGTAELTVGNQTFPLHPFGLENDVSIEAPLVFVDNAEILKYDNNSYKNKIILSYNYSRAISKIINNSNIAAFISIGSPNKKAPSRSHRQYEKKFVPCATITYDDAEKLLKYSGEKAKFIIKQTSEEKTATNIIVDIPGKIDDGNTILAVAHYDTVARSMGSSDNGGGTVTLLKIAEYFTQNIPQRKLRLIFFSGEELGLLGSLNYAKKHKDFIKENVKLIVNIDVSGDPIGIDKFIITGTKEILGYIDGINREQGLLFKTGLDIYSSDNMPFTMYEIPSVNIARFGGKASVLAHTPDDKIENVSAFGLENTIKAAITSLDRLLNSKIFPIDSQIDKSLREKIEKYLYNLTGEDNLLRWIPSYKK